MPPIGWKSKLGFGIHANKTLIVILIKYKDWIRWAYEEGLHHKYATFAWLTENLSAREKRDILGIKDAE